MRCHMSVKRDRERESDKYTETDNEDPEPRREIYVHFTLDMTRGKEAKGSKY